MKKQGDRFVVVADAIVGRGCVYQQGHVLEAEQLWGYEEAFLEFRAIRRLPQPAPVPEREAVSLC